MFFTDYLAKCLCLAKSHLPTSKQVAALQIPESFLLIYAKKLSVSNY